MMVRKIFRAGNTLLAALPNDMLESLQLEEGSELFIMLDQDRRQIIITPSSTPAVGVDAEFARQLAEFMATYRPALEALAH